MGNKIPYITAVELDEAGLTIRPSRIWEFHEQLTTDQRCRVAGEHTWLPVRGEEQPPDMILLECKHCETRKDATEEDEY